MLTREHCQALDRKDHLRTLRDLFVLPPDVIYLDGNSLGALPKATQGRVAQVIGEEWGRDLIRSWNSAGWFAMPQRLGNQIAQLIGAGPDEVVATDSTSINLYKALSAAVSMARQDQPQRKTFLSESTNFPTDLYIAQALAREHGMTLRWVEPEALLDALDADVAILMLTHVNYRTGAMHDMAEMTAAAHANGTLTVWDLAHSAGAVPVDLRGADADFAVGCGYKYLNGGPGAPAFIWVHPRHADRFWQPLAGWWGHAAPFAFDPDYRPAAGIARYLCGTQSILGMAGLECGLDTLLAADALAGPGQGMRALRAKSLALTDLFIALVEQRCSTHHLQLVTPRDHARRGSQVCLTRSSDVPGHRSAYAIIQALIARGVIGDFRAGDGAAHPDILRFGFTPLYLGFEDVWNAVEHLLQVLERAEWQDPQFNQQHQVT